MKSIKELVGYHVTAGVAEVDNDSLRIGIGSSTTLEQDITDEEAALRICVLASALEVTVLQDIKT